MTDRTTTTRALPMLEFVAEPAPRAPRRPSRPGDRRLTEYLPESRTLPRFHVWTLGCQMNRSDSEEMAGRLLTAGCEEAASLDDADLVVINTCAIREGAEQKVIGRMGQLTRLKAANPALRVVLTGCSVREPDRAGLRRRYPAVDLFLRPDEEPELIDRLGLASAQAPIGLSGATTMVGRSVVGVADHLAVTRARAVGEGSVARGSAIAAWLPIIYGCDKTCTYCIVPFSRGPERSRPFDDIVDEARSLATAGYREVTLLGQNVNSYGHDLPPDPRFGHVAEARRAGRRLDLAGRPDLAELIRAIDGLRTTDGRPAIGRLRFVTSHPWDLSDRLIAALAECDSVCEHLHLPVQSGSDAVLHRMGRQYTIDHYQERLGRIRAAVPGITVSTDVIVGFCGETEAQFEETLALSTAVRYDQVFAAAYSPRPGTPATRLADDVPAADKRRRLNTLLALQETIGLERNEAWLGREVEVLVDAVSPARDHAHDGDTSAGRSRSVRPDPWQQARPPRRRRVAWSAGPSASGSSMPARTRCGAPSSARDGRAAPRRHRRADGDRQDRARHPPRGDGHRRRPAGGHHLGGLAPGLPRARHRDGQGLRRRPGARPASRPRPGRSRPSRSPSPTSPITPAAVLRDLAAAGGRGHPRRRHGPVPAGGRPRPRHRRPAERSGRPGPPRGRAARRRPGAARRAACAPSPADRRPDRHPQSAAGRPRPRDRRARGRRRRCRRPGATRTG